MNKPCARCGQPAARNLCPDCEATVQRRRPRRQPTKSPRRRGYDAAWQRLSARARRLQPFCSDCGATEDLQADHTPEAWQRKAKGLPVRLQDIDVVCGPCNRKRGAARGKGPNRRVDRSVGSLEGTTGVSPGRELAHSPWSQHSKRLHSHIVERNPGRWER